MPTEYDKDEFARIQAAAKKIQLDSKVLVVTGIGGTYLGARERIYANTDAKHNVLKTMADTEGYEEFVVPYIWIVGNPGYEHITYQLQQRL